MEHERIHVVLNVPVMVKHVYLKEKAMKKVLLSSTALVFAAGMASAEINWEGSAEIVYGNFGTGTDDGGDLGWSAGTDVDIKMSGGNGDISYSATLELDETDPGNAMGPISLTMGAVTLTYDKDGLDDLTVEGTDGEDDNVADAKVSYSMGAISASIAANLDNNDTVTVVGYKMDGIDASMTMNQGATTSNEFDVAYTTGAMTIDLGTDDSSNWDAGVSYDMGGGTTVGLSTGSDEINELTASTNVGAIKLSIGQEFGEGDATSMSAEYAADGISFSIASDTANSGKFGDEAETVISVGYDLGGGASVAAKANDQDEMELKLSFTF